MTLDTLNPAQPPPDPTAPKEFWRSTTFWLGLVLTLVGISTYFSDPLHTPTMTVASISEAVGGVAAIVLRVWFTNSAVAGTPAAAKANLAKQNIALHAAMNAAPGPVPAPASTAPTLEDLPALLAELKQRHDKDGALLAELAGAAGPPAVGAWTGAPLPPPPAVTTP